MNLLIRCLATFLIAMAANAGPAATVSLRLGTGRAPSDAAERLPQALVAEADEAPKLDGRLDDKVWSAARPIVLGALRTGAEASPRSEVRLLHRGGMLYVGCRLTEPDIGKLKRNVTRHDGPAYEDDSVELFLSPDPARGYFQIIVSASGAIFDRRGHDDPAAWNSGARAAVAVAEGGWSLEAAVPLASLGASDKPPPRWRANIYRNHRAGPEGSLQAFSPTFSDDYDVPARFGVLSFAPELRSDEAKRQPVGRPRIEIERLGDRGAVLLFDLSAIPRDAAIHRARLVCRRGPLEVRQEAAGAAEIYPLLAAYEKGRVPEIASRPLELAGPQFDSFDMTQLLRDWVAGRGKPGLYVTTLHGWQEHATCLDVVFEGRPQDLPPQATGLRAFHRAGQTFITWHDPQASFGDKPATWGELRQCLQDNEAQRQVRYRLYRHTRPIDAGSVKDALLLAEVEPLSGFNINSWSLERLVNQIVFSNGDQGELMTYGPFENWNRDSPQGATLVIPRLAVEDGKALPPGTGLYVRSARSAEKACYALTALVGGVENLSQFSAANSIAEPVAEAPATWRPVEQPAPDRFGFDFRGQRHFYVTWTDAPLSPRPMYFNWSVLVPRDCTKPVPVELYFHAPGHSHALPPVKFLDHSIQICPHDFPFSGWYGYNDAAETLKAPAAGVVRPYTIRRIDAFLKWAEGRFPVDRSRVVAVGGDGAALVATYRPALFAYALITGFEAQQLDPKAAARFAAAWGPPSPQIKDESGRGQWAWGELDVLLSGKPLPAVVKKGESAPMVEPSAPGFRMELPLFVCRGYSWGRDPSYGHGRGRFYYALQGTDHALCAHWAWGGNLVAPGKYSGLWQGLDLQNTTAVPAITNSSLDQEGEGSGHANSTYVWRDVKEDETGFEATIAGQAGKFDLTPRRLSKFVIRPGQNVLWQAEPVETPTWNRASTKPSARSGVITADGNGLVKIKGLELAAGCALRVRIKRAE